ncbi:MAG TPA: CdaR family protein, partial [Verrucomicrobiae bacterium]|nr:CdaR family protein [Verrucomicrobiae bacterium]
RDLFFRDFWLKLFSLVLAVLIWKIVSLAIRHEVSPAAGPLPDTQEQTFENVRVSVVSAAEDVRSFKVQPTEVAVTVRGDVETLQNLQPGDIRAQVDLTDIESAHQMTKRIEVFTPPGVTHVRTTPEQVSVVVPPKR